MRELSKRGVPLFADIIEEAESEDIGRTCEFERYYEDGSVEDTWWYRH